MSSARLRPPDADYYAWPAFERWADIHHIGEHENEWAVWWECWKGGYIRAKTT